MFIVKDSKICVTMAEQVEKSADTEFLLLNFSFTTEPFMLPLVFPALSSLSVRGKAVCAVQRTALPSIPAAGVPCWDQEGSLMGKAQSCPVLGCGSSLCRSVWGPWGSSEKKP